MADEAADKKMAELTNLGGTAIKPVGWDRTGWEAFRYMLWNPDTGEVLTRTPLSWLKITVFYCIYYSFLAAFWIACLQIFFQTLPEVADGPKWQQGGSLIGVNPGVGLRPRNQDSLIDSQMFVLQDGEESEHPSHPDGEGALNADYAERVRKFLTVYDKPTSEGYEPFVTGTLDVCGTFPYGYVGKEVAPCIFFKLNNIWGWEPKPVECGDPAENGEDGNPMDVCPESLVDHIASQQSPENVYIDCNGRNAADQEQLEGKMTYFPASRALPFKYFPYLGQKEATYHSPLVAVKVKTKDAGQLVHIECRAYFRGVVHDKKHKLGLVQFEVQIMGK